MNHKHQRRRHAPPFLLLFTESGQCRCRLRSRTCAALPGTRSQRHPPYNPHFPADRSAPRYARDTQPALPRRRTTPRYARTTHNSVKMLTSRRYCAIICRQNQFGTEKYPRGRRGSPAKGVVRVNRSQGSNPCFSASQNLNRTPGLGSFLCNYTPQSRAASHPSPKCLPHDAVQDSVHLV